MKSVAVIYSLRRRGKRSDYMIVVFVASFWICTLSERRSRCCPCTWLPEGSHFLEFVQARMDASVPVSCHSASHQPPVAPSRVYLCLTCSSEFGICCKMLLYVISCTESDLTVLLIPFQGLWLESPSIHPSSEVKCTCGSTKINLIHNGWCNLFTLHKMSHLFVTWVIGPGRKWQW